MKVRITVFKILQLLFPAVVALACMQVQGQTASDIASNLIALPVVRVGEVYYSAELTRQQAGKPDFQVTRATPLAANQSSVSATFTGSLVEIPSLTIGATTYQLQMQLVSNNPLVFRLSAVTVLATSDPSPPCCKQVSFGYATLSNGRGGVNYEPVDITLAKGFDKARSLAAFTETLYPWLRSNGCATCHSSINKSGTGAQAPMHSDENVELAHDYALTRVNFADVVNSKFVVREAIDKHNCPRSDCATAATEILAAVTAWKSRIADVLPQTVGALTATITEAEVVQWIADDKARLAAADRDYIIYTSMHELYNEGLSDTQLDVVRTALSKALNSVARWAPAIVNPQDVNGKGILYKFDMRDYWGWNKGITRLLFGGSDDDLAFGKNKRDYRGTLVTSAVQNERYNYAPTVSRDPAFAKLIWERVLHGNVEGAVTNGTIPAYINGFHGKRSSNAAGEFIAPADFEWVETSQLIYTLTRPDVYNAVMVLPMYTDQLEDELGVDKSAGMDSYDYVISFDAITVDSRLLWYAKRKDGGWFWKTWDIFTGQLAKGDRSIFDVYREGGTDIRFPWWANPVPKFVDWNGGKGQAATFSFIASLAEPFGTIPAGCDPVQNYSGIQGFYNCRHYTGTGGLQQSAEEMIWDLPNGLQGYALAGAFNQRRVDAFVNIVRDPRVVPTAKDDIATRTGFIFNAGNGINSFDIPRLNTGSSCIGCHIDGMNRVNNNLRDWVDEGSAKLPSGPYGVDKWINDPVAVARVKELYPPSSVIREYTEAGRKSFLGAMAQIKQAMVLGTDKNVYVEPVIWTVEYVQRKKYKYPQTTSN